MPNWCWNSLDITGKVKDLKDFDKKFKGKHTRYGASTTCINKADYNPENYKGYLAHKVIPYSSQFDPPEQTASKYSLTCIDAMEEKEGYSFNNFVPMSKEDCLNGWRNWSCDNWGTKWDICDVESNLQAIENSDNDEEISSISYSFDTAWSPCIPVVAAMAKAFKDLDFIHWYDEEGMCFAGQYQYEKGELSDCKESDGNSYRKFLKDHDAREYYTCKSCGALLEEYELEDNNNSCSECGCKEILDTDGQNLVEFVKEEVK